jgi:hypothetical protein
VLRSARCPPSGRLLVSTDVRSFALFRSLECVLITG